MAVPTGFLWQLILETQYRFGGVAALMRSSHWERVNLMTAKKPQSECSAHTFKADQRL
jgi:hypothetical protein